jgi:hypothetical protein
MSNFEYLMWINMISGRSYNDLSQYPVFPWTFSMQTMNSSPSAKPIEFLDPREPDEIGERTIDQTVDNAIFTPRDLSKNLLECGSDR